MNKLLTLLVILISILSTRIICNAQAADFKIQVCNYPSGNIKKAQVDEIAHGSCDMIKFFDADGNEVMLKEFEIGSVKTNAKNRFWSSEKSGKLTTNQKKMLAKLAVGDEFQFQHVVLQNGDKLIQVEKVYKYKIVK